MFIRSKTVNGQTYYALVRGVRDGGKVRHETIVSLGTCPTLAEALKAEQQELARLNRERGRFGDASTYAGRLKRRVDALDRMLARSAAKIDTLKAHLWVEYAGDVPDWSAEAARVYGMTRYLGRHARRLADRVERDKIDVEAAYRKAVGLEGKGAKL